MVFAVFGGLQADQFACGRNQHTDERLTGQQLQRGSANQRGIGAVGRVPEHRPALQRGGHADSLSFKVFDTVDVFDSSAVAYFKAHVSSCLQVL